MSFGSAVDIRPLPVAIPPALGETLRSYMDRLAADLDIPLGLLLASVGIYDPGAITTSVSGYGFALTATRLNKLSYATGQTEARLSQLLLTSLHGTIVNLTGIDAADPATFRQVAIREWLYVTGSHFCPVCLTVDEGVWQMAWRLPWSFACTKHQVLLVDTCPGCNQRPQGAGRHGHIAPNFTSYVPSSVRCSNRALPGRGPLDGGKTCGTDLRQAAATWIHDGPVLRTQKRLNEALVNKPMAVGSSEVSALSYLQDFRSLISILLLYVSTEELKQIVGVKPRHRYPDWVTPELTAAWQQSVNFRQEYIDEKFRLDEAGIDRRRRRRYQAYREVPTSAALMALMCTVALPILDAASADAVMPLVGVARRIGRQGLATWLSQRHASSRLVALAKQAQSPTGTFAENGALTIGSKRSEHLLDVARIPALLWLDEWPVFAPLFTDTAIRPETARRFVSIALVKAMMPLSWGKAGEFLGWPLDGSKSMTGNVIVRLRKAGAAEAFHVELTALIARLLTGETPLPDLAARRRGLSGLTVVPPEVLNRTGLTVTHARCRHSAAWIWAELTSGSLWEAPAWGGQSATPNQRIIYRVFLKQIFPRIEVDIRQYGQELLQKIEPKDNCAKTPERN